MDKRFDDLTSLMSNFANDVMARFDEHDVHFDRLDVRFDTIDARLDKLEAKIERLERWIQKVPTKTGVTLS